MKDLRLPVTKIWFNKTKSGEKTEDYREINRYWIARLIKTDKKICYEDIYHALRAIIKGMSAKDVKYIYGVYLKSFRYNIMTLGYPTSTDTTKILMLKHNGIEIRTGNQLWGAEKGKYYFVIKHGNIIN